jgi:hypothetical protein
VSALRSSWPARAIVLACVLSATGCSSSNDWTLASSQPTPAPPAPVPPTFDALVIPTWPPLGPNGKIEVRLSDDEGLARITATFKDVARKTVGGKTGVVSFTGSELGEGSGTLTLIACDARSACRERWVSDLLVDLTPPDIELERPVVSSLVDGVDGQVAVWVTDGWVLGSVELTFAGKVVRRDFPAAYPSTLGTARDVSRVAFPASAFPDGTGAAVIVARDAAGNERTQSVTLRIDGTRPIVTLLEPQPGTQVRGALTVRAAATDDSGVAPTIDLWVGGARVLTGAPATTTLVVDTSTLPPGSTEVRAVATDEAGNESVAARAAIELLP